MSRIAGIKGMRHIALKVKDVTRSKRFYQDVLGMDVVWEPDPQNVYLSSGCDNIAIHGVSEIFANTAEERQLDHLGFVVEDVERVRALENELSRKEYRLCSHLRFTATAVRLFTVPIRMALSFNCSMNRS
ncbi:MAG: VOC family protein [Candidatus Binatia bacterium]